MGGEWLDTTLGEVLELKRGYDLPKRKRENGLVPIISSAGVSDSHSEAKVTGPGVVTGRYGTIGSVYFCSEDFWPLNTTLYVRDFKNHDEKFIYYFLKTIDYDQFSDKAAVPGVNRNHLHMADITFPSDLAEQKAIAHILSALDDKIELNRQMNATLESMAQSMFASWFVDFDPVIDNALAAGNPIPEPLQKRAETRKSLGDKRKRLPEAIQKQFPSRFIFNDEMGWVPEGWKNSTLNDLCELITDGSHQSPKSVDDVDGLPMASSKDLTHHGIDFTTCRSISKDDFQSLVSNGCAPNLNDVLIAKDGSRCGETCCIYPDERPVVLLSSVAILRPQKNIYSNYINTFLSLPETIANLRENYISGSAIPRIVLRDFKRYPIVFPPGKIIEEWNVIVGEQHRKMIASISESNSLHSMRDTLLPKLLSGELRIPDAEKLISQT